MPKETKIQVNIREGKKKTMKKKKYSLLKPYHLFKKGDVNVFSQINKTTVLQEARVFNDSPINVRKCRLLLTKIIYLLSLGEPFNSQEATDLFFNVIKLFQSKDVSLSL